MMLELNNYYIQELENLTYFFTNIFLIIYYIYNEIIPIVISNINNFVNFKNYILSKSNLYNNFIGHLNKHN